MDGEQCTPFTMPLRLPQLLDLGPMSFAPPPTSTQSKYPHTVSPSPYPPSSDSESASDSEGSYDSDAPLPASGLRTSVAALSESKLRRIMVKLADSSPQFHRAIMKELACAREFTGDLVESPPGTPIKGGRATQRRRRRRSERRSSKDEERDTQAESQRNFKNLSVATGGHLTHSCGRQVAVSVAHSEEEASTEEYVYHPGHLDEEVYEFFSPSTDREPSKVMRTVTMWTCCDEDEWSPGCVSVPAFADHALRDREAQAMMDISNSRALADSELEHHRYDSENSTRYRNPRAPAHGYRSG